MFVVSQQFELLAQHPALDRQSGIVRPLSQRGCYQDGDAILFQAVVRREIFSFEVGVDRHLKFAASTNGRDEVDGDGAALLPRECHRFWGNVQVHNDDNSSGAHLVPCGGQ